MVTVQTGTVADLSPEIWARLRLLQLPAGGFGRDDVLDDLEEFGLPRQEHPFVETLHQWARHDIDPDAAFALWLLRQRQQADGSLLRRGVGPASEISPTIRFVQLATMLGETVETDESIAAAVTWLVRAQLPDGSMPDYIRNRTTEFGTTARALLALQGAGADAGVLERMRDSLVDALAHVRGPERGWPSRRVDAQIATGSSGLCLHALSVAHRGWALGGDADDVVRTLVRRQQPGGGWAEYPGGTATINNTFSALRALASVDPDALQSVHADALQFWLRCHTRGPARHDEFAFWLRVAAILGRPVPPSRLLPERRWREEALFQSADTYSSVALMGIAVTEHRAMCAVRGQRRPNEGIPKHPPAFLLTQRSAYELLYVRVRGRRGLAFVSWTRHQRVLERFVAGLLAIVAAVTLAETPLFRALESRQVLRSVGVGVPVALLFAAWLALKRSRYRRTRGWLASVLLSVLLAVGLGAVLGARLSAVWPTVALALILDVVRSTASRADVLERLVPEQ